MVRALRIRLVAALVLVATTATGCGVLQVDGPGPLDGEWTVSRIVLDGADLTPESGAIVLRIDSPNSTLAGRTSCRQIFGSFTITSDGRATFTVPTPPPVDCSEAAQFEQDLLIGALERSATWSGDTGATVDLARTDESLVRLERLS